MIADLYHRLFTSARQSLSKQQVQWLGYDYKSMKRMIHGVLETDSYGKKSVAAVAAGVALSLALAWIFMSKRRRRRRQLQQIQQHQQPLSHTLLVVDPGTRQRRRLSSRTTSIGDLQAYLIRQQRSMTVNTDSGGGIGTSWRPYWTSSRELEPGDPFFYPDYYHHSDAHDDALEMAHVSQELLYHIAEFEERQQQQQQQYPHAQALFISPRFRARTRSSPKVQHTHNHGSPLSSTTASFLQIKGPSIDSISYRTMVPPPTWTEASRNLMLSADDLILSRTVTLHIPGMHHPNHRNIPNNHSHNHYSTAVLSITKKSNTVSTTTNTSSFDTTTTTTFSRNVEDCRIHIRRPAEGGVMDIYERREDAPDRSHWMEHAFSSAAQAAQFQLDLLSLQIAGNIISNMYQAFAILHQGSMAYIGEEPVMHFDPNVGLTNVRAGLETQNNSQPVSSSATATTTASVNPENDKYKRDVASDSRPVIAHDSGIAWDDVMRCLGTSYPSIRLRLEAMWWLQVYRPPTSSAATGGKRAKKEKVARAHTTTAAKPRREAGSALSSPHKKHYDAYTFLAAEYASQNRRLLLGPVDFFRLFVPILPETAVPEGESSRLRMEKMLRWRKRIASAAVMVQSYAQAKIVSNRGWKLCPNIILPDNYLKRRLAFDDDVDNRWHDAVAKNEYYEATVSRDIVFRVRCPQNWFPDSTQRRKKRIGRTETPHTQSLYQGYSLVGIHAFHCEQATSRNGSGVLHYMRDPVQMIPSLRALIKSHPEVDFFVNTFCAEAQNAVIVQLYVRSLPKGVDSSFDNLVHRFIQGDANVRNRKLHVILQLGIDRDILSWFGRFLLWCFSFLLRLTFRRHIHVTQPALKAENRTFIPAINLSELGETCHFGGSLQTDPDLPRNYVASTLLMSSKRNNSFVTRMLLSYIELGGLAQNVSDFTFILMGDSDDELPERPLCTFRAVHVTLNSIQMSSFATKGRFNPHTSVVRAVAPPRRSQKGTSSLYFKIFVTDPTIAVITGLIRSFTGLRQVAQNISLAAPLQILQPQTPENMTKRASIDPTAIDPFEKAVNDLVEILENVRIPVRRDQAIVPTDVPSSSTLLSLGQTFWTSTEGHNLGPEQEEFGFRSILRMVSREDMKRYFIASDCSLRIAAVRLIESCIWRETTFPIDIRTCRIELQNGQFFQQGKDKNNNPVFYFRNTCLGPWRKDEDAVISAVLHRLEGCLNKLTKDEPNVQCTLIVVMGKPYKKTKRKKKEKSTDGSRKEKSKSASDEISTRVEQSTIASTAVTTLTGTQGDQESGDEDDESATEEDVEDSSEIYDVVNQNNPRVYRDEQWHSHTNRNVVDQLLVLVMKHYPERLSKALIVLGHGNKQYVRSAVGGVLALPAMIPSSRTREKIVFLTRYRDLQNYVDDSQLLTFVGGSMLEDVKNYEYK